MSQHGPDPARWPGLEEAAARYDDALAAGDEHDVAAARLALCQVLLHGGWETPEVVVGQMLRDAATLERLRDAAAPPHAPPVIPGPRRAVSPVEVLEDLFG